MVLTRPGTGDPPRVEKDARNSLSDIRLAPIGIFCLTCAPPPISMHRFKSTSSLLQFWFSAILFLARWPLSIATCWILLHSLATDNRSLAIIGLGLIGLTVLMVILQWLVAARATCPLCRTAILAPQRCARHRRAMPLLGSHRLRVAQSILFRGSFLCPCCHEPTAMEVQRNGKAT